MAAFTVAALIMKLSPSPSNKGGIVVANPLAAVYCFLDIFAYTFVPRYYYRVIKPDSSK